MRISAEVQKHSKAFNGFSEKRQNNKLLSELYS